MSEFRGCDLCGYALTGPWLLLNRYGVGTGGDDGVRALVEGRNGEDGYLWQTSEADEDEFMTGPVLCWPACATQWIDAKMAEAVSVMKRKGE